MQLSEPTLFAPFLIFFEETKVQFIYQLIELLKKINSKRITYWLISWMLCDMLKRKTEKLFAEREKSRTFANSNLRMTK